MSISSVQSYQYQPQRSVEGGPFFRVDLIELETFCSTNQSHRSDHYKIFLLEEGSGQYAIDFKEFTIDQAGLFCLSPGQVLTVQAESMKSGYQISFNREFYCVETHGKEIACNGVLFNNVYRATFLQLNPDELPGFRYLIQQMIRELQQPAKAHLEMLETYLRMLLIETLRKYDERAEDSVDLPEEENQLVSDFIALVNKHFREVHAVADYAEMLFVSPKSLAKRLNARQYPTPTQLIKERILLEAKRDLRFSRKSIKEIAYELGFDDPGYFTRYFKKSVQQSPQAYRDRYS